MRLRDSIKKAAIYERGQWFTPGEYVVEVVKCIEKQTRKSGLGFIVECRILESNSSDCPVGSKRTWYQSLKNMDVASSALLEFAAACEGVDHDEANTDGFRDTASTLIEESVGEENALAGRKLRLECFMTKTKENKDFTVHRWFPCASDDEPEEEAPPPPPKPVKNPKTGKWELRA